MHCDPNIVAAFVIKALSSIAIEFIEILSAPAFNTLYTSLIVLIPPPIVNGIKHSSAISVIISILISSPFKLASISRTISSSTLREL